MIYTELVPKKKLLIFLLFVSIFPIHLIPAQSNNFKITPAGQGLGSNLKDNTLYLPVSDWNTRKYRAEIKCDICQKIDIISSNDFSVDSIQELTGKIFTFNITVQDNANFQIIDVKEHLNDSASTTKRYYVKVYPYSDFEFENSKGHEFRVGDNLDIKFEEDYLYYYPIDQGRGIFERNNSNISAEISFDQSKKLILSITSIKPLGKQDLYFHLPFLEDSHIFKEGEEIKFITVIIHNIRIKPPEAQKLEIIASKYGKLYKTKETTPLQVTLSDNYDHTELNILTMDNNRRIAEIKNIVSDGEGAFIGSMYILESCKDCPLKVNGSSLDEVVLTDLTILTEPTIQKTSILQNNETIQAAAPGQQLKFTYAEPG